jgi:hypothetical protein
MISARCSMDGQDYIPDPTFIIQKDLHFNREAFYEI